MIARQPNDINTEAILLIRKLGMSLRNQRQFVPYFLRLLKFPEITSQYMGQEFLKTIKRFKKLAFDVHYPQTIYSRFSWSRLHSLDNVDPVCDRHAFLSKEVEMWASRVEASAPNKKRTSAEKELALHVIERFEQLINNKMLNHWKLDLREWFPQNNDMVLPLTHKLCKRLFIFN
ncbi:hypothetical protein Ciccas_013590 [Cichlidogyrus casuarinus]|uniref:Uncharacterized protein n=1 Tax=Cichlidogyrus casuarinus TaxID=1844966 RepID=A0ABD2PNA3_9PLAT